MPTVREYEQALQKDPASAEAFIALRKVYREGRKFDRLVTLYETRAQAIEDQAKAAELFYLAAEVRLDHLDDVAGAEADLAHAVDRDSSHLKATKRLKDIYREQGRTAEYLTMLEMEAAAVARTKDPARVAELQAEMGQLYAQQLAKLERTLTAPGRQGQASAADLKTIESARKIYRALGDWNTVVRLYELELAAITDAKRRADLMLGLGRVLSDRIGDLEAAAARLAEVVRLRPRDDKALEALAAVYASPSWTGPDGGERAASLYQQVARRRQEAGDVDNALAALRKALAAVPGHAEASELIERVLYDAGRLPDLDRYYRERVAAAQTAEERMDFLFKRAQLAEGDLGDAAEALRVYEEIVSIEPPGGPASQHLASLYQASQDFGKLALLRERQLETAGDPAFRLALLQELASLYRERLGDREQAAVHLHAILQLDPHNAEALQAYADHFRQRGEWKDLADLLEFAFETARGAGAAAEDLLPRLEEIAAVSEGKLNDVERALATWQKIEELAPGSDRAREAQKRILQKAKQWDRMAAVLEREAKEASDPVQRIEILRRLARIWTEKLGAPDRAAGVYREILTIDQRDVVALRALLESYEKGERWDELAKLLREQLDLVASKQERLNLLRRLLVLYDERLADLVEGSWAAAEILKVVPGDRDALARLEAILERSDDKVRLVQTLEYHTRYASGAEEKVLLIRRIADLLQNHLGEIERATTHWEQLLKLAPDDPVALEALAHGYERLGREADLARVLELQIARAHGDAATQADCLRRLGRLAAGALAQPPRAQRAWEELLRLLPSDPEALEALSAIYEAKGDFRSLVLVLERRVPLASDPQVGVRLALDRARLIEEQLRQPDEAIRALEQIIAELDPRNAEAHERLRRVAEARGDWARVVNVAERQLFLTEDPAARASRALEIGQLWRDRLSDPQRALAAFERAVEIDPENVEALYALAPLYAAAGDAERLIFTNEKLLAHADDGGERRRLMFEIAETCERTLKEPRMAFGWYRRAYQEAVDDLVLQRMEAVAEAHGLWEDLVQVYAGERARSTDPTEQVQVALKVAGLCETRLKQPARAFVVLRDALAFDPSGAQLVPELERLAEATSDWSGLLDVYARVARGRPGAEDRVALLGQRAQIRERRMNDASGAMDELLRAFALSPERDDTQQEVLRLAEVTGRWEDALGMLAQVFTRAYGTEEKVAIACRAAALVEEKVRDRLRAFRAYLNAFRMAPDNEAVVGHLWRLAALVGRYDAGGTPTPAPARTGDTLETEVLGEDLEVVEELEADEAQEPPPSAPLVAAPAARSLSSAWEEFAQAYELLPAADNGTRHAHLLKVAEIYERGAKDLDLALGALERALRLDTGDETTRAHLERIGADHNRWDHVCDIYLRAVDGAAREEAVALHHRVAHIRTELGQSALAEERYSAVLTLDEADVTALERLETLYRSDERWSDLASVLERRTAGGDDVPPDPERRHKWFELAELYEKRLERPYEAIDTLEKYAAGVEDDERGLEGPELLREAVDAYDALARLYTRVGLVQKAVGALEKQLDLVVEPAAVRAIRWRIAELYERELAQPDQAAEAYSAILVAHPDDAAVLAALDRLHQARGDWEALADVLRLRMQLVSGAERAELGRRRARILEERLGNPDEAAACLRELGADVLADDEATAALLRNLRSAGLAHEAGRVLTQRIDVLGRQGVPSRQLAALHLELAALRSDQLGDAAGARQAIELALALAPEDGDALAALARLDLAANDFASYAATLLRQARAQRGTPAAAAALIEAGAVYRDQLADATRARDCFERAAQEHPDRPEVLHALASSMAADGRHDEALGLYEKQLELESTPAGKAAVLTDLARTLWEASNDAAAAIGRLDEALELAPDHLPAVVTMADIYYREQQWEQAERRLNQAIRRLRGDPQQTARLYHRLAEVYERLGRLDEGYRQLVEADRAVPGQLLLRIALGGNRFQARRWREAAQHLDGIADHPDAASYPDEVAEALARAAQAEMKLKRPERAVALYEAALRFKADHVGTLRALADMALERGDRREAATYLRRVAGAAADRSERARLLAEIGELLLGIGDRDDALRVYEQAVATLDRPTEDDVVLLEKTLELQRSAGASRAAIDTARRIADLVSDPRARAARWRDLAGLLLAEGDHQAAADLLAKALADNPADEQALVRACEAFDGAGRAAELEALLARSLPELPLPTDKPDARNRRASLWERLGTLQATKNAAGAIAALEKAVAVDPQRVEARVELARLYDERVDLADAALENHRMLALADVTRDASLRALGSTYASQGRLDWARCCFEMLDLLGLATAEDREFLEQHPAAVLKPDDPYAGTIEEADRARLLAHPEARIMAEVFAAIWEGVPGLGKETLESFGVSAQDKISPISELDIGKIWGQTSKALGNKRTNLYINWTPSFDEVAIVLTPPPAIVIGQRLATEAAAAEMRFCLGRALELTRPEYILAATVASREFASLFSSVLKAFHPRHSRRRATEQDGGEQVAKLKKALPYKVAKRLAELFQENSATPFSSARWRQMVLQTGNRAGLLMAGDLAVAARIVLRDSVRGAGEGGAAELLEHARKPGPLRELLRYAVSEEYFSLREALGTGVTRAAAA